MSGVTVGMGMQAFSAVMSMKTLNQLMLVSARDEGIRVFCLYITSAFFVVCSMDDVFEDFSNGD